MTKFWLIAQSTTAALCLWMMGAKAVQAVDVPVIEGENNVNQEGIDNATVVPPTYQITPEETAISPQNPPPILEMQPEETVTPVEVAPVPLPEAKVITPTLVESDSLPIVPEKVITPTPVESDSLPIVPEAVQPLETPATEVSDPSAILPQEKPPSIPEVTVPTAPSEAIESTPNIPNSGNVTDGKITQEQALRIAIDPSRHPEEMKDISAQDIIKDGRTFKDLITQTAETPTSETASQELSSQVTVTVEEIPPTNQQKTGGIEAQEVEQKNLKTEASIKLNSEDTPLLKSLEEDLQRIRSKIASIPVTTEPVDLAAMKTFVPEPENPNLFKGDPVAQPTLSQSPQLLKSESYENLVRFQGGPSSQVAPSVNNGIGNLLPNSTFKPQALAPFPSPFAPLDIEAFKKELAATFDLSNLNFAELLQPGEDGDNSLNTATFFSQLDSNLPNLLKDWENLEEMTFLAPSDLGKISLNPDFSSLSFPISNPYSDNSDSPKNPLSLGLSTSYLPNLVYLGSNDSPKVN